MSSQNESNSPPQEPTTPERRVCPSCGKDETETTFYKNTQDCRSCVLKRSGAGSPPGPRRPLAERAAEHKAERERQRILREELKKIARERIKRKRQATKRAHQKRKIAELIPALKSKEEAPVVDPILKEMARRILVRRNLIEFVKEFHPNYKAGWVHHDICARLEKFAQDVADGKSPRLMIMMPPRHGKSQLASKLYPAWHLGHYPDHEFIACSYNISLALDFSREVRGILRDDAYQKIFENTRLDPDYQSAEAWKLHKTKGGYVAAGIGGGITGKGAHVLVIDDPIKNDKEADSIDVRDGIWNWYQATAYTRLAPGGGVLVIQTCWHDDDLAGRLQREMRADQGADQWEIVRYPAIAEEDEEYRLEGDPLHEERYDYEALMRIKRNMAPRFWAALYQQNPVPEEGAFFTKDMFVFREQEPDYKACYFYQAWDFAIGEKRQNDWTVGFTIAQDFDDFGHVVDVMRFRSGDAFKICDSMLDMWLRWSVYGNLPLLGVENGQIWKTMEALFLKRCQERKIYPSMADPLNPITDKQVRARPLQGRMQQRRITYPKEAPWLEWLIREKLRFPTGEHDDGVDAESWTVQLMLGKTPPARPKPTKAQGRTLQQKLAELAGKTRGRSHMAA